MLIQAAKSRGDAHTARALASIARPFTTSVVAWQAGARACSTAVPREAVALSSADLQQAAKLARLSGFCYLPSDTLSARLRGEGFELASSGKTSFTRWYTAHGIVQQTPTSSPAQQASRPSASPISNQSSQTAAPMQTLIVQLRGVSWKSEETEMMRLGQNLLKFWPVALHVDGVAQQGMLQAHGGMAEMAREIYTILDPQLQEAKKAGHTICFAGHSLGGALATLLCSMTLLQLQLPAQQIMCTTFGSPPVLAHKDGKDGDAILQVLGLSPSSMRSFVLASDPIPRAMLSVDPTFAFFKQWPGVASILSLRDWFTGQASGNRANAAKFMFNNVGEVHLINWSVETGHRVTPLAISEIEEQLKLALDQLLTRPQAAMQALLDHTHHSYAQDLQLAAKQIDVSQSKLIPT